MISNTRALPWLYVSALSASEVDCTAGVIGQVVTDAGRRYIAVSEIACLDVHKSPRSCYGVCVHVPWAMQPYTCLLA